MRYLSWIVMVLVVSGLVACGSNLYRRAEIYEERGDYRSALDAYQQIADSANEDRSALAHAALGRLYVKLGRYWEAKEHLELAKQQIPSGETAYAEVAYYLGYCYYEIGEQWSEQAIESLEQAVAKVPRAHLYLSVLYFEQGQYQAALRHTDRIGGDDEAQAKYISGLIYRELGGVDNAQKAMLVLQRAVELEKDLATKRKYQALLEDVDKNIQQTKARAQKIEEAKLKPVFAAIYRHYEKSPIGQVTIYNPTPEVLQDATLSLEIGEFMDQPETYSLGSLAPRDRTNVELRAHFNTNMLNVRQDLDAVPVSLTLQYVTGEGQRVESAPLQYLRIHGMNALNWKPQEAIAAFVTHKNDAVATLSRHASILGNPLEKAIQIYEALNLYGIQYELDPQDAYGEGVDYVFHPYETLQHRKGDCDDLSVLYASCLQNIGIDTSLVLTPTHIYVLLNTGMSDVRAKRVIPDGNLYLSRDRMAWLPVEVTMLGKGQANFVEAWLKGSEELRAKYPVIEVQKAWAQFQPATQGEAIPGIQDSLPTKEDILKSYNQVVKQAETHWKGIFETSIQYLDKQIADGTSDRAELLNRKAIRLAWLERFGQAEQALREAATLDPSVVRYHNNLASVLLLQGNTDDALEEYHEALATSQGDAIPVHLNLAIYYLAIQDSGRAQEELARIGGEEPDEEASEEVLTLARELGIPITTSPRAGDLPNLVKDKITDATATYPEFLEKQQCVDEVLQQVEEGLADEERASLRENLQTLRLEQLKQLLAKPAQIAKRDLIIEGEEVAPVAEEGNAVPTPVEQTDTVVSAEPKEEEAVAGEEESVSPSVEQGDDPEPAEPLKLSRDQLQAFLTEALDVETTETRASGISEPEGLQWWLYWME